jgi:hypothetical protein
VILASCGNKTKPETSLVLSASDTAGLAEFRQWKTQQEMKTQVVYVPTTQPVKTVYRTRTVTPKSAPVSAPARKKGWSKAAKGAAIGAATGAAAGAIINKKNRALGGVIGGVIGGGVGYGIGRGMDKKDGRF